jgi:uncharacterized repeat protein (TIGR01451 family)
MFLKSILLTLIAILMGAGFVFAGEIDDATIFVEAFNAFQKKDYLLALEKANQLNQVFPDSPLKDVTLLLVARSSIKSGDNELAAKSVNKFKDEFSDSALVSTIEEDLLALGARHLKGEQLQPNRQLQAAAQKVRDDRQAQERVTALKLEQERLAREKAERERIAMEKAERERIALAKAEAERKERERIAREKAEKESIKVVISVPDGGAPVAAGQNGSMQFEISNSGIKSEEFLLEASAAAEYGVSLTSVERPDLAVTRVKLAANEIFKGRVLFRMPADKLDGHRAALTIKSVSSKYSDVIQVKNAQITASAPFVRVVAKLARTKVTPGEQLRYRVTVLNIGSLTAEDLTVRVKLPPKLDFVGTPDAKFRQEQDGTLVFRVDRIETGKLADISLEVKVREDSSIGQELRGQIEVVNGRLQRKDTFTSSASVVQGK